MKLSRFLAVALLASFVLVGCSKEARVSKKLVGIWDVTSWTVDGTEYMEAFLSSATIVFSDYSKKDSKGDYKFTVVDALFGTTTVEDGTYSLNSTGEEIEFSPDNGDPSYTFVLTLDGDNLEMEGTLDGVKHVVQAKRQ